MLNNQTARFLRIFPIIPIIFRCADFRYHSISKPDDQCRTDEDNEIGGKKGHKKRKWIIQFVCGYEQLNSENEIKAGNCYKYGVFYPPNHGRMRAFQFIIEPIRLFYQGKT